MTDGVPRADSRGPTKSVVAATPVVDWRSEFRQTLLGLRDAALEAYKDCLKSKKRDLALLKEARYERALLYVDAGKKAQGRKELEKIYAEDASFRDVRMRIEELTV